MNKNHAITVYGGRKYTQFLHFVEKKSDQIQASAISTLKMRPSYILWLCCVMKPMNTPLL